MSRRTIQLPAPADASGLELERLRLERDAATARAETAEAELHRVFCGLWLIVNGMQYAAKARRARKMGLVGTEDGR